MKKCLSGGMKIVYCSPSPMRPIIPRSRKKALKWGWGEGKQEEDMNTGQNEWLFLPQYLGWIGKVSPSFPPQFICFEMGLYSLRRKVGSPPLPTRCGPRSAWGPRRAAPGLGAAVPSAHREGGRPGL